MGNKSVHSGKWQPFNSKNSPCYRPVRHKEPQNSGLPRTNSSYVYKLERILLQEKLQSPEHQFATFVNLNHYELLGAEPSGLSAALPPCLSPVPLSAVADEPPAPEQTLPGGPD